MRPQRLYTVTLNHRGSSILIHHRSFNPSSLMVMILGMNNSQSLISTRMAAKDLQPLKSVVSTEYSPGSVMVYMESVAPSCHMYSAKASLGDTTKPSCSHTMVSGGNCTDLVSNKSTKIRAVSLTHPSRSAKTEYSPADAMVDTQCKTSAPPKVIPVGLVHV